MKPPQPENAVSVISEEDARLLAVEFGEVPFEVKRVFVITRTGDQSTRGNHFAAGFQQLILLNGEVRINLEKTNQETRSFHFTVIGSSVTLSPDDYITYELLREGSQILVLADRSYADSLELRKSWT